MQPLVPSTQRGPLHAAPQGAKSAPRLAMALFAVAYVAALVVVFAPQGTFAVQGGGALPSMTDQP